MYPLSSSMQHSPRNQSSPSSVCVHAPVINTSPAVRCSFRRRHRIACFRAVSLPSTLTTAGVTWSLRSAAGAASGWRSESTRGYVRLTALQHDLYWQNASEHRLEPSECYRRCQSSPLPDIALQLDVRIANTAPSVHHSLACIFCCNETINCRSQASVCPSACVHSIQNSD